MVSGRPYFILLCLGVAVLGTVVHFCRCFSMVSMHFIPIRDFVVEVSNRGNRSQTSRLGKVFVDKPRCFPYPPLSTL